MSSAINIQTSSSNQHLTSYNFTASYALSLLKITYSAFLFFSALNTQVSPDVSGGHTLFIWQSCSNKIYKINTLYIESTTINYHEVYGHK